MNATKSLLDQVVLPTEPVETPVEKSKSTDASAGTSSDKKTRRKPKPYEAIKGMTAHADNKKAARKAARGKDPLSQAAAAKRGKEAPVKLTRTAKLAPGAKTEKGAPGKVVRTLTGKGAKVKLNKQGKKDLLTQGTDLQSKARSGKAITVTEKAKGKARETGSTGKNGSANCSFCGKPLSRHTSVANGMGDVCRTKHALLPAGTTLDDHYASLTVHAEEDIRNYIPVKELFEAAKKVGVSGYRVIIAYGGDRMLRPPLNEHFRIVIYKGRKYVPKSALKNLSTLQPK